ncbi:Retrovirus-related Pol polyprotein from transposon TNT 1-94 [Cucumis melo var. makuwa]|uniref:Retrovirus-related Pol polyprotein from transposon TNT 1-94 n=1 Tax=Cucumis melo var. makuwa TaxID=1194695 RepID=A0A5D3C3L2_CUCMM|nr:Retrovirus-related Pol polyprotein from transposon TNT 1-94 [Cucumis melo var. makuwa]
MLSEVNLPYNFWTEAVATTTYTINKSPSTTIDLRTAEELWKGRKPDLSNLKVFNCVAYAHSKQGKLDPRALKCMFLGYSSKDYKLWDFKSTTYSPRRALSKVEFLEKENEEVHEDQLERSTEILLRTVAEQETQDDQDLEDLSNYTLTRDR